MTIKQLQDEIRDYLNGLEKLVQGGCKAFSEDCREVYDEAAQWTQGGKIALVVVTPRLTRNGASPEGMPVEAPVLIRCIEAAAVAEATASMRALDAAAHIAVELDGLVLDNFPQGNLNFNDIDETADARREVFTATVRFNYAFTLTVN